MKVSDLIAVMREDYLDDVLKPHKFGDKFMLRSLNRAEEEACLRQPLLVDQPAFAAITLQSGVSEYDLDDRVVMVRAAHYETKPLRQWSRSTLDAHRPSWQEEAGEPTEYLIEGATGMKFRTVQTPGASEHGRVIDLTVWRQPEARMSQLDHSPEIPLPHHFDLMWFVLSEAVGRPDEDTQDEVLRDRYMERFDGVFGPRQRADVLVHNRKTPPKAFIHQGHDYMTAATTGLSMSDRQWEKE